MSTKKKHLGPTMLFYSYFLSAKHKNILFLQMVNYAIVIHLSLNITFWIIKKVKLFLFSLISLKIYLNSVTNNGWRMSSQLFKVFRFIIIRIYFICIKKALFSFCQLNCEPSSELWPRVRRCLRTKHFLDRVWFHSPFCHKAGNITKH